MSVCCDKSVSTLCSKAPNGGCAITAPAILDAQCGQYAARGQCAVQRRVELCIFRRARAR